MGLAHSDASDSENDPQFSTQADVVANEVNHEEGINLLEKCVTQNMYQVMWSSLNYQQRDANWKISLQKINNIFEFYCNWIKINIYLYIKSRIHMITYFKIWLYYR